MSAHPPAAHDGARSSASTPRQQLAALALGALGVVYGDIGTSPLYALRECVSGPHGLPPTPDNVLGVLSLIFWSLTMVVSIKYLTFVMRADNSGEGGILALLGLVLRGGKRPGAAPMGRLVALVLFGAGLLYGESAITPAISVLSAIEGLAVAAPTLKHWVVPLTCVVLLGLFSIQKSGTARVGSMFGPVMLLWFSTLATLGVIHMLENPEVLEAISPVHAVRFFLDNRVHGFIALGSVVLAFTGVEALYADMGHFGRAPIRMAWFGFVFPALLLNYFGQGALLLRHPELAPTIFFSQVPTGWMTYALVGLSTAATIIASQALISGIFSLTSQAVQLGYFPRVTVRHTSASARGQIYSPEINWGLATACLALVLGFRSSGALAAAYGIAVTGTLCITSVAFFNVMRNGWGWSLGRALPLLVLFLSFDVPYFSANLIKLGSGGYIPILGGAFAFMMMFTWKKGRILLADHFSRNAWPMERFRETISADGAVRVHGGCVVMASTDRYVPLILTHHVQRTHVLHETVILLTVIVDNAPRVDLSRRFEVTELGEGLWRVILHYGFMEEPEVPSALVLAIKANEIPVGPSELTYFIGHETLVASDAGRMKRWQEVIFAFLARNALPATAYFRLPPAQVVELGVRLDL